MATEIPLIPTEARPTSRRPADPRAVLIKEMEKRKIPLSIGKICPVKCTFCYEIDHSYRATEEPGKTTQEDWNFILEYISRKPTRPNEQWVWGGNEYMAWTDLFLHPKAMEWLEDFLKYTDKNVTMFTVGYVHVPKIHQLALQYPNRFTFDLSVTTLHKDHRKALMPHAPSVSHLLKVLDGPAVSSANFYSFGPGTMSEDAKTISRVNPDTTLWMGCLTPLKGLDEDTVRICRQGKQHLPEEAQRVAEAGLPNTATIHTEPYVTAFLNRHKIMTLFDSLGLEKHDTVVMAKSVYRVLTMYRKNRARYLCVPNATLGGDSDCTILLTFDDILKRLNGEKIIHLPKVVIESPRGNDCDISGVTLAEFVAKAHCKVRVIHKVSTKLADRKLWEHGYLSTYIRDYVANPAAKEFERIPVPA
jgi:hypothetical protein